MCSEHSDQPIDKQANEGKIIVKEIIKQDVKENNLLPT